MYPKKWLILATFLCLCGAVSAATLQINLPYTGNTTQNVTFTTTVTFHYFNTTTNSTEEINQTVAVMQEVELRYSGNATANYTFNFDGTQYSSSDNSAVLNVSNEGKNYTFDYSSQTDSFLQFEFKSDFEKREELHVLAFGNNCTYQVYRDMTVYVPKVVNSSTYELNGTYTTVTYGIQGWNETRNKTLQATKNETILAFLVKDPNILVVGDRVQDKVYVTSTAPVVVANFTSSPQMQGSASVEGNVITYKFFPESFGKYTVTYHLVDAFGNTKDIETITEVRPTGTYHFPSINVPSLKVGDLARFKIFEAPDAVPLNFTIGSLDFNRMVPNSSNSSDGKRGFEAFFDDGQGGTFYLLPDNQMILTKKMLFINIRLLEEGELSGSASIGQSGYAMFNEGFTIHAKSGNVSVFENQTLNVGGRSTTCELVKDSVYGSLTRRCYVDFPVSEGMRLDNDLVILSRSDYTVYEDEHRHAVEEVRSDLSHKIENIRDNRNIIAALFGICLVLLFVVWYPWDYVAIPGR